MLLCENFLAYLRRALLNHPVTAGCICKFDEPNIRFKTINTKWNRRGLFFRLSLFLLIAGILSFRIAYPISTPNSRNDANHILVNRTLLLMLLNVTLLAAEKIRVRSTQPEELVEFINAAIQFEQIYGKHFCFQSTLKTKLARVLCQTTPLIVNWIFAGSMAVASVFEPSLPINFLGLVLHSFAANYGCFGKAFEILKGFLIFLTTYLFWDITGTQGYRLVIEMLVGSLALSYGQKVAHREMERLAMSQYPISAENFRKRIKAHRFFQLLVEQFNIAMRTVLFGFLLSCGVVQIVTAFLIIRESSGEATELPYSLFISFITANMDAIVIIVIIYGFAGELYQESTKSLDTLNKLVKLQVNQNGRDRRREVETYLRSFRAVRLNLGLSNYVERSTPLVIQMFCLERIIDLLLVK